MDETESSGKRRLMATLAVLLVIVVIVGGVIIGSRKKSGETLGASTTAGGTAGTGSSSNSNNADMAADNTSSTSMYKDGSYTATGSYSSPGGVEAITISVMLKDGAITDTSAQEGAIDREGSEFQSDFIAGYKRLVVGKKIDSVRLSRVSGSSLTSQGFNDAIDQIKTKAQS